MIDNLLTGKYCQPLQRLQLVMEPHQTDISAPQTDCVVSGDALNGLQKETEHLKSIPVKLLGIYIFVFAVHVPVSIFVDQFGVTF